LHIALIAVECNPTKQQGSTMDLTGDKIINPDSMDPSQILPALEDLDLYQNSPQHHRTSRHNLSVIQLLSYFLHPPSLAVVLIQEMALLPSEMISLKATKRHASHVTTATE
jgi:hypothetical protein